MATARRATRKASSAPVLGSGARRLGRGNFSKAAMRPVAAFSSEAGRPPLACIERNRSTDSRCALGSCATMMMS